MLWGSGNSVYGTAGVTLNPYTDYVTATSYNASDWFRSSGTTGWYNGTYYVGIYATDSTWVRTYNNAQFYSSTIIQAGASVRGPIFYDSDDTGYYLNPAGASNLYGATFNNPLTVGNSGVYMDWWKDGSGIYMEFTGNSTATRKLRLQGHNGSMDYTQLFIDGGNGYVYTNKNFRATVFYDQDNTGYYLDPASTSNLSALSVNSTMYAYNGIQFYRNGSASTGISWYNASYYNWQEYMAAASATGCGPNGNLTAPSGLTSVTSWALRSRMEGVGTYGWLWEVGSGGGGGATASAVMELDISGNLTAAGSHRAPIFYDYNNTGYYIDPAGTARLSYVAANAGIRIDGNENLYLDNNYGQSIVGLYSSYRYQGIFAMGNAYKLSIDGSSAGSLYGIAWSHPNAGGVAGNLNSHGALFLQNGSFMAAISTNGTFSADVRATIFYDYNDTGYYLDLNSTSNSAMRIRGGALFGPNPTWGAYLRVGSNGNTDFSHASVVATNGNLHMDPASSCHMYLNYYVNGYIYLNGSSYYISTNGSYYNGTAAAANSVAWTNVSSRPTALSQFSNDSGFITSGSNISGYASYLPTLYAGGQQTNPQVYFNNGIGLRVAMTGAWSVWSDTIWVNGYSGGDVPWTVAMHFLRNSEPRMALSAQTQGSTGYGSYYEVYTDYNVGSKRTNALKLWATSHPSDYYIVNNWTGTYWQLTSNHPSGVQVAYADSAGNSGALGGYGGSNWPGKNGNSYYQVDTWLQLNGYHGLYAPSWNSAHWYPNSASSYTTWAIAGSRGSYGGIYDGYSAVHGIMYDSGGNGGVYREANGRWYWYYHLGNACMGIGSSTTSSSYVVYASGAIYATGNICAYSDVRKKENIETIDNALDKVNKMRGVYYNRTDDETKKKQTGVIAQEMEQVLPEVVNYAADVDEYSVAYGNIVGVLIEAIKEQQLQIDELKALLNK